MGVWQEIKGDMGEYLRLLKEMWVHVVRGGLRVRSFFVWGDWEIDGEEAIKRELARECQRKAEGLQKTLAEAQRRWEIRKGSLELDLFDDYLNPSLRRGQRVTRGDVRIYIMQAREVLCGGRAYLANVRGDKLQDEEESDMIGGGRGLSKGELLGILSGVVREIKVVDGELDKEYQKKYKQLFGTITCEDIRNLDMYIDRMVNITYAEHQEWEIRAYRSWLGAYPVVKKREKALLRWIQPFGLAQ